MPDSYGDWDALEKALTLHFELPPHTVNCICISGSTQNLGGACWTIRQASELLGFHRRAVERWRKTGRIRMAHLDDLATRMDRQPEDIWPEWDAWMRKRIAKDPTCQEDFY